MTRMRDLTAVKDALKNHQIELPSWAFGNSGTRFKVFGQPGVPRNPYEKADDAAQVHKYTGVAPSMAVHIPWDKVDDYAALSAHARHNGIGIGTVNANVFQDDDYKLGSVCNPDPKSRKKALAHLLECVDIMDATGSRDLKLWFADGTNYPGQDDIAARQDRLADALAAVYERLGGGQRMLLEYKLFEPSFYTTDVPDWGTALLHCQALGDRAQVVVDTGHHAPGVNIEFIVALLLKAGRLGGFDFNSRFYADDDLMVGTADPFQLFRIMHEVVKAAALYQGQPREITASSAPAQPAGITATGAPAQASRAPAQANRAPAQASGPGVAFMLDQCHNIEPKIPAQIRSVMNVQEAVAKALLVDSDALREAQLAGDVLGANAVLMDAYNTDVRPLLAELRAEMGLAPDPVKAYLASGYGAKIVAERVGGTAAGWGA
jgi:L-rhamnose isomerase/sugar isomerase